MFLKRGSKIYKPIHLIVLGVIFFVICMIVFPSDVLNASKIGVSAWWNIVFPALLPFFISSELLMSYGVVQFMGVIFEPVMRPLFNLPGPASFVVAVGYTSGFPISASLTAKLRTDNLCTRGEGERLMSFTNNASPLFMLVAVGVGMFQNPKVGILIATCHYLANLTIGICLRFYNKKEILLKPKVISHNGLLRDAIMAMKTAYRKNPRPFAQMLSDAINSSMAKLATIAGFMMIFAIIIKISDLLGFTYLVSHFFAFLLSKTGFHPEAIKALSSGLFEITLGSKSAAEANAPLLQRITITSAILGWSGLSVLAQVNSMISKTDLRVTLFVMSRMSHAVISALLVYFSLHWTLIQTWLASTAFSPIISSMDQRIPWLVLFWKSSNLCLLSLGIWAFLGTLVFLVKGMRIISMKLR